MAQWEYKMIQIRRNFKPPNIREGSPTRFSSDEKMVKETLEKLSEEDWELVGVLPSDSITVICYAILKRKRGWRRLFGIKSRYKVQRD